ncbi:MAG: omptin family outer membrane protease [Spirochaetaceae bacterium]|nr:omptin family outer membrane protease [Spirochaetaceae bacterium]
MVKNISFFAFLVILFVYIPFRGAADTGTAGKDPPGDPPPGGHIWSLGFRSGVLWGGTREQVFREAGSDDLLSRLDWELKPLVYFGAVLGMDSAGKKERGGFFQDLGLSVGVPMDNGTLEDRDWEIPGVLTQFSRHPAATINALLLDYRLGFSLPAGYRSSFNFFLFFSWNHFSWVGRDGYGQYTDPPAPWTPGIPKDYNRFRGKDVIRYAQDWVVPGLGWGMDFSLLKNLDAGVSLLFSPLVLAVDKDEHFLNKDTVFRDYLWGGFFLEASFSFALALSPGTRLRVKTASRVISGSRGNTYIWQPRDVFLGGSADTAGAYISYVSAELTFEWALGKSF